MGKSSIAHFKWWSAGPGAYRASSSAQNKAFGKFTFRAMGMSHLEKTPTSSKKKKKIFDRVFTENCLFVFEASSFSKIQGTKQQSTIL